MSSDSPAIGVPIAYTHLLQGKTSKYCVDLHHACLYTRKDQVGSPCERNNRIHI
jgi:hypothetical protein